MAASETLPGNLDQRPEEALAPGRVLGGRYEILEVLGKGGMGWVYKARDREIDRLVALKVIRQDLAGDETVIKRFRDEIILARKVTHKNVLRIHDIAEAEGIKFISMPFIDGKDLKTVITERGALGIDETVRIAVQVAHALKSAHEAGVIHRDLKPQNIMIDSGGTAYVTDFGIAKSAEAGGLTVTGQIIGTPDYMSPEQAEGRDVDYRTDIYSFGLVLYEMLTGAVAFKADTIISTLMKRLRESAEPPSKLRPEIPEWLERLTMKAMERNLEDRYASVDDILADIESETVKLKRKMAPRTMAVVAAIAVVGVIAALFFFLRPTLVVHKARTYLAILPFENVTKDSSLDWLAAGIPDNLTADLAQSRFFRLMSPERLRQIGQDLGKDVSELTTPEGMRQLAKAADVDAVAVGSYAKAGDKIRITIRVEGAKDQELIGTKSVEGPEDDLFAMIDELTRLTKQIFNLSQKAIAADLDRELAVQRTKSVAAASGFAKGLDLSYRGAHLDAARAFEDAIGDDPDFALAYAKAAEAYRKTGYDEKAERLSLAAVDKAIKFSDRVTPADRAFIMAGHAEITHNSADAIKSYNDFIAAYPDDPEGYYKLGMLYLAVSDWSLAAANFTKAISLDPKFASARFELAKVLINQDALDQALEELEQALALYKDIGSREGEADVLNAIGVLYKRRSQFDKAVSYYEQSLKLKEELGDKRGIAATLGNLGSVYEITGKKDQALEVLARSLEIRQEIGDKQGVSTALNKIGQIYQSEGRFEQALSNFQRSYEIRREIGAKDYMASSLSDMGNVYSMMGRYDKAIEMDSLALALRTEIGDARDRALSLRNIAETLINRGRLGEARGHLEQVLTLDRGVGDARSLARDQQVFGLYYLAGGMADSAIACLGRALEAQTAIEDRPAAAVTVNFLGEAHLLKGNYKEALRDLDQALRSAVETGERELAANAMLNKARVFLDIGYLGGADSALATLGPRDEAALAHQTRCYLRLTQARRACFAEQYGGAPGACAEILADVGYEDVRCRARTLALCARADLAEDRIADAVSVLDSLRTEAQRYGLLDVESEALRLLAMGLARQGKHEQAMALADDALEIARRAGTLDIDCLLTCGDVRIAAGDQDGAVLYLKEALDRAGLVLDQSCPRRARQAYLAEKHIPNYAETLGGLLAASGRGAEAAAYRARFNLK